MHNLEPKLEKKSEEHQYTQNSNLNAMLQNSQNSQSEGLQLMGMGATIGSAFGPVGTAVGAVAGAILCLFVCHGKLLSNSQTNKQENNGEYLHFV